MVNKVNSASVPAWTQGVAELVLGKENASSGTTGRVNVNKVDEVTTEQERSVLSDTVRGVVRSLDDFEGRKTAATLNNNAAPVLARALEDDKAACKQAKEVVEPVDQAIKQTLGNTKENSRNIKLTP